MSLRNLHIAATTVRIFLRMEGTAPSVAGSKAELSPEPPSNELARQLGLVDPSAPRADRIAAFRVLGFDSQYLWCDSSKIVGLDRDLVQPYPHETNCGGPNQVDYIDWPKGQHLPFVYLDYFDSLINFSETDQGDLVIRDSPTLDARVEEIWWDGVQYHARVWLEGSYKGKHKSTTVEFTYDPIQQEICAEFETVKNDYIRVQDIKICWYLGRNVICASATVIWRPRPEWRAHVEVCMALAALIGPRAVEKSGSGSQHSTSEGKRDNCGECH